MNDSGGLEVIKLFRVLLQIHMQQMSFCWLERHRSYRVCTS